MAESFDLQLWDQSCARDNARQGFVLPMLRDLIDQLAPIALIDIGAKTGYLIAALLDSHNAVLAGARVIVMDRDAEAVTYMRRRFRGTHVEVVHAVAGAGEAHILPSRSGERALHILSYTALEMDDDLLRRTFATTLPRDLLVVILPDATEDVRIAGKLQPFLDGQSVCLEKIDEFTGRPYPFIARRFETWLPWALDCGLSLSRARTYRTPKGKRHFLYQFDVRSG